LSATEVQSAIDEINAKLDNLVSSINSLFES
jgi:hypothetical protein